MAGDRDNPQRREQPEPTEGDRPVPRLVLMLVAALVIWGTGYIIAQTGYPLAGGDSRTPVRVADAASISGKAVYSANCTACHQASGQGVPGSFPPLSESRWVTNDPALPVAIVSFGLQGPIQVAGERYNGSMPAFGGQLSDAEIAAVISYIRAQWGNQAPAVDAETVKIVRKKHAGHRPWTADALRETFDVSRE